MQEIKIYTYEQRSPEWYKVREAKITASDITSILGPIGNAKTQQAIDNKALELAIEAVHGMVEDNYINFDMQRGIDNEPSAFECLKEHLALNFIDLSKIGFVELNEHIGASPDGLASNNHNAEIKCPSPKNYFKFIAKGEISQKYFDQMQHQMLCTNTDGTYFVNYCVHMAKEYVDIRIVPRDEKRIELIKQRCELVIEKKLQYIDILNGAQSKLTLHDGNITIHEILKH